MWFKIFYTNCDCLTKEKFNDLELLNQLIKPVIICLTEVLPKCFLLSYTEDMFSITRYNRISFAFRKG